MNEATAKRPSLDLDEFERRLRGPVLPRQDDPLAELARLVGQEDPFRDIFAGKPKAVAPAPAPVIPAAPVVPAAPAANPYRSSTFDEQAFLNELHGVAPLPTPPAHLPPAEIFEFPRAARSEPAPALRQEPTFGAPQPEFAQPEAPIAAIQSPFVAPAVQSPEPMAWQEQQPVASSPAYPVDEVAAPPAGRRRSMMMVASVVGAGLLVAGGALMLRDRGLVGSGQTPVIRAANNPVKVQPPAPAAPEQAKAENAIILDRSKTEPKPAEAKVVSNVEQPVDLSQAPKQVRTVAIGAQGQILPEGSRMTTAAIPAPSAPAAGTAFPEPKKVRTVSVRPDGSVVTDAAPVTAPPPPAARAAATPAPSTPKAAAPVAPAAKPVEAKPPVAAETPKPADAQPKATVRVTNTPAAPSAPPAAPAKPKQVAAVAPNAPMAITPGAAAPAPKAAEPAGTGDFAVQFAAAGSEQEAKSVIARINQQFGAQLGGRSPVARKAQVGEKTVYRVRVGGMSRDEAADLCGKLKASGGNCFVAR